MNAHTPFDAKQDWTNPYCQNSSNDPMVDALLGNAYHVVRTVYCNLGNLKLIYDFLNKYGMVLGVQSEAELKAMPTSASYVRLYGFDNTNKRVVTDYLYVDGDRTGVIPDDPSATGSWILVATSNSGSGEDGGDGKASTPYIPYTYNNGSAIGGETTIPVPSGTVGVPMIVIDGYTNLVGYGFTYDASTLTVTLAQPLEPGDEVHLFLTGTPAVPDNPNVTDWVQVNWLYNGGYAVGGEQVIAIPYTFESVPAIYKNGERYYAGLADKSYTVDAANQRILLTEPLATDDRLIITIGGESTTLIMSDRTIHEVARSANVQENEVILSTNTTQYLNGMKVIYDVVAQKSYGLPTLPTNVYINSVSNGQLTYSPGNITVDLVSVPESANELKKSLSQADGDSLIGVRVATAERTQHDKNMDLLSVRDFGILGDGTDETTKWESLVSVLGGTRSIIVPPGTYNIASEVDASNLTLICDHAVFTGSGYLKRATITGVDSNGNPLVDMGSTVGAQDIRWGKLFKVGSADSGLSGLQIGGAGGTRFGAEGMVHHLDGYDGWAVETPSRWPSSAEHALMPSSRAGRCSFTAGNKTITIQSGANLLAQDIGQVVWIKDIAYVVETVATGSFTVTNAPTSSGVETYTCTYNWGKGKCSVNGKLLKCISGDPFNFVIPTRVVVNGVVNYIDGFTDTRNVILRNDMGQLTNVDYFWSGTVDDLASAFRLHRISGAGYEENISLIAYNKGYYHLHAGSGGPSQLPFFIGSGWDTEGAARKSITVSGDGLTFLGGKYGVAGLEVGYRPESNGESNRFRIDSAQGSSGDGPTISTVGPSTNINFNIRAKGTGVIQTNSELRFNAAIYPNIDNTYTVGRSDLRVSQFWGANATIQTSDGRLKSDITDSDLGIEFVRAINPVSYKFIEGGKLIEEVETGEFDVIDEIVTKTVERKEEVFETRIDEKGNKTIHRTYVTTQVEEPVYELVDVYDENDNWIRKANVPKTRQVKVPHKEQQVSSVTGKRTHYGFIAQQVKEAIDKLGIKDFGGYVEGEDGTLGLRYEEFIAPLYKAVCNIDERLQKIEDALNNK